MPTTTDHPITTESTNVWISNPYHEFYPEYVKIIEVLPDGKFKAVVNIRSKPVITIDRKDITDSVGFG